LILLIVYEIFDSNATISKDVTSVEYKFDFKRYGFEYDLNKDIIHTVRGGIFIMTQCKLYFTEVRRNCFFHLGSKAAKHTANFISSVQHNR